MAQDAGSNPFGPKESGADQISKRYFFVYEGRKTEPGYFEQVVYNKAVIGIKYGLELISLKKYGTNVNETSLDKLITMSRNYRDFYTYKRNKLDFFVDVVLNQFEDRFWGKDKEEEKELHKQFVNIRLKIEDGIKNETSCSGFVDESNYEDVRSKCLELVSREFKKSKEEIDNGIDYDAISPDKARNYEPTDEFCVIRDRDYDSKHFTDITYNKCIIKARRDRIRLIITTPMFEYWLLLHHLDDGFPSIYVCKEARSKFYVQNRLDVLEGRRDENEFDKNSWQAKARLSDSEERELNKKRKEIGPDRFNKYYLHHIKDAVRRSLSNRERTTDVNQLVSKGGTMMGLLFQELIS